MTARHADEIAAKGRKFGAELLVAMETLSEACEHAGRGLSWSGMAETVEQSMEAFTDTVYRRFYGEDAAALFLASARTEFYGSHASADLLRKWSNAATHARQALAEKAA